MLDVSNLVKAHGGDVFGGFIRDWRLQGSAVVRDLDVRVDKRRVMSLLKCIDAFYRVVVAGSVSPYAPCEQRIRATVHPRRDAGVFFAPFQLDVTICSHQRWVRKPCDFDVNLLAENGYSQYVRGGGRVKLPAADAYSYVRGRVRDRRFAALQPASSAGAAVALVDRACSMVRQGWVMDDEVVGPRAWVVAKHGDLACNAEQRFAMTCAGARALVANQSECAFCAESFAPHDVVIVTACKHVFHWQCGGKGALGLRQWVGQHEQLSCPKCRARVV